MFERFTDRARRTLVIAQEEARLLDHDHIGTEHILLGLIHEGEGVAARALESLGIVLNDARAAVEDHMGRGVGFTGSPPFTPGAKKALELSLREAMQLGHNYIGTEHLLLALVRDGDGDGGRTLALIGANPPDVRTAVIGLLRETTDTGMEAVERDRVEKVDPAIGAGALIGSDEAKALIVGWLDVDQRASRIDIGGVGYDTLTYQAKIVPGFSVGVVGGRVTKQAFDGYTRLIPDAEKVTDLGDAAAFSYQRRTLRVLSGTTVLVVRVTYHPRPRDAAIDVARVALGNLAGAGGEAKAP